VPNARAQIGRLLGDLRGNGFDRIHQLLQLQPGSIADFRETFRSGAAQLLKPFGDYATLFAQAGSSRLRAVADAASDQRSGRAGHLGEVHGVARELARRTAWEKGCRNRTQRDASGHDKQRMLTDEVGYSGPVGTA
jgi:hypothetical protein